ncbi:MAG: glycosyltransferase family 4 protein [Bacteroidetes bacterium]|nr:glycosyltransferase family 4 protein [Bacteroidota bacterium]
MNLYLIILTVCALIISALTTKYLLSYLLKKQILDIPNDRSSHTIPTPRGGGIGIIAGVSICMAGYAIGEKNYHLLLILGAALGIAIIGFVDDVKGGLNTGLRFLLQIIIALAVAYFLKPIEELPFPAPLNIHTGYLAYAVAVIWLVGVTNIFNFLDGIDGIAGIQGLITALAIALLMWGTALAVLGLVIAASCLGFLIYNWHPAKIFMGDVGSSFLGFLFAAIPFYVQMDEVRYDVFLAMAIFLWFFLIDGAFTMIRRMIKREKIWQAHRSHIYQRLVISGLKHSTVVLLMAGLYAILLLYFFGYYFKNETAHNWAPFIAGLILFGIYVAIAEYRERYLTKS